MAVIWVADVRNAVSIQEWSIPVMRFVAVSPDFRWVRRTH